MNGNILILNFLLLEVNLDDNFSQKKIILTKSLSQKNYVNFIILIFK